MLSYYPVTKLNCLKSQNAKCERSQSLFSIKVTETTSHRFSKNSYCENLVNFDKEISGKSILLCSKVAGYTPQGATQTTLLNTGFFAFLHLKFSGT